MYRLYPILKLNFVWIFYVIGFPANEAFDTERYYKPWTRFDE